MYVVAGATGNTGSVVAKHLLAAGKPVRVIVRDEAKAEPFRSQGAEVAVADVADAVALAKAIQGARGVYALNPPALHHHDPLGLAEQVVAAWAHALRGSNVGHVAFLSSIGAQHPDGTGLIRLVHKAEQALRDQPVPITFVRAAYFLENWGMSLGPAFDKGVLYSFQDPERAIPMVATRDIGRVAAEALLDPPSAHQVIELAGPRPYSPADVASAVSRLAGKPISVARVPGDHIAATLTSFGISQASAELYREMVDGIESGRVSWEGDEASVVRGSVTLEQVLASLSQRARG